MHTNKLAKPYTLVHVNLRMTLGYQFIGEVMSFPIPNGVEPETVMVRRAPGHPGTLIEVPVSALSAVEKGRTKFIHYAAVADSPRRAEREDPMFPVDMLRYDCAAPVNFEVRADDYHGTVATVADEQFGFGKERVIACVSAHRDPDRAFCKERWGSFLRSIRVIKSETIEEATK